MAANQIVVVGSCMMDFVSYAPRLPQKGETIHGSKFITTFGGKGANQCVAAAKLGAKTALIARVGDDIWGDKYLENLKEQGVNCEFVKKTPNSATGIAQITVSERGENQIVIVAGANKYLGPKDLAEARDLISNAAVLVLQLETPQEVALEALRLNKNVSILNGAPALVDFHPDLLRLPTIFCVNETEASIFSGLPVTCPLEAEMTAQKLLSMGCNSVLLTLGVEGALYMDKRGLPERIPCPQVECVDSTGAGDAFIGALSHLLALNKPCSMGKLVEVACAIASDTVTRPGTQISFAGPQILKRFVF